MQETPEPQDAPRSVASAGYNHDADYLGYAGDLGYEHRADTGEQPEQGSGTTGAATAAEPADSSPAAHESAAPGTSGNVAAVPAQSPRSAVAVA